jgi:hypothetical protein
MEAFRYGLSIPYIQDMAIRLSRKVLDVDLYKSSPPVTRRRYRGSRRYRTKRVLPPRVPKPPVLKIYTPPVFSIELDNMFEVLDI